MSRNKTVGKLKGQNIIDIWCKPTPYGNNTKLVTLKSDSGELYKMEVKEFLKIINDLNFDIIQKTVHKWLKISEVFNNETNEFELISVKG